MKKQTPKKERRLKWSDAIPFTFGRNYAERLGKLESDIGTDRFKREVSGLYTKAAFVGLVLYDTAMMAAPVLLPMYEGIRNGIEAFVN